MMDLWSFVVFDMSAVMSLGITSQSHQFVCQQKGSKSGTPVASKMQNKECTWELNGVPPMDIDIHNLSSSPRVAVTPLTLMLDSLSITPTPKSPPDADTPPYKLQPYHTP